MSVDLNRERPVAGILFNPANYYRMIGPEGWQDFQTVGALRPRATGKYLHVFFMKGHALDRYRSRKGEYDYVVEVSDPTAVKLSPNGYPVAARSIKLQDATVYRINNSTGQVVTIHTPS